VPVIVLPVYALLAVSLVVLSVIDVRSLLLPSRIVAPVTAASIAWLTGVALFEEDLGALVRALACATVSFGAFLAVHVVSPRALGFGDVRLTFLLGFDLGWLGASHVVLGLLLGFVAAAVVGLVLVAARVRALTDALPFGPFLAAGALATVGAGDVLLQ
jgi:leader peptidase (prepilin peptidase)/N-methyltransferase